MCTVEGKINVDIDGQQWWGNKMKWLKLNGGKSIWWAFDIKCYKCLSEYWIFEQITKGCYLAALPPTPFPFSDYTLFMQN